MTQLEKNLHTVKAHGRKASGLLSRFILVPFALMVSLAPLATVLAQEEPAQTDRPPQGATIALGVEANAVRPLSNKTTTNQLGTATQPDTESDAAPAAIRPFRVSVPEEAIVDLRRRIAATRWPDRETVKDQSQGVQLAKLQELVRYWGTDYDWRKAEAKLNALPQFVTNIDGVDIQFVHVRSRHPNALPLIMTHGWPGSILELLKVIGPLTDPTAYGGRAEDAFDLVLPTHSGLRLLGQAPGHELGTPTDRAVRGTSS